MEDQGIHVQVDTLICTNRSLHDNDARYAITMANAPNVTTISRSSP